MRSYNSVTKLVSTTYLINVYIPDQNKNLFYFLTKLYID